MSLKLQPITYLGGVLMATKYHNKITIRDGLRFDSQLEANTYTELKLRQFAGQITDLKTQVPYVLVAPFRANGRYQRGIRYIADFEHKEGDQVVVTDAKGVLTQVFRLKRQLFLARYPEIRFEVVRRSDG